MMAASTSDPHSDYETGDFKTRQNLAIQAKAAACTGPFRAKPNGTLRQRVSPRSPNKPSVASLSLAAKIETSRVRRQTTGRKAKFGLFFVVVSTCERSPGCDMRETAVEDFRKQATDLILDIKTGEKQ